MTPPTVNAYYSPRPQQHQLPRRHPAAAVLSSRPRRGGELRRRRRGDRPRADARLRRSGPQVRRPTATCATGGRRPTARPSRSARPASRINTPGYTVDGDTHVNGRLTLGENTADNGGLRLALMAYLAGAGRERPGEDRRLHPEQRVFLGWAQVWCENARPEAERLKAATNPHSSNSTASTDRCRTCRSSRRRFLQGQRADGARQRLPGLVMS